MVDAYDFTDGEAESLARHVQKLRCGFKSKDTVLKCLKAIAHSLEAVPQDISSLGSAKLALEEVLIDRNVLKSKHKDVKMYAAACMAHMLRIYAPETPYEDRHLEPIFELLLWSVQQVADYKSPMFETALTVVQTINQTKSYFLLLDSGRVDVILEWVRALLQSINAGSSAMASPHILELLQGIVGDESTNEAVLEVLLSYLVPPRSVDSPHACQVAQAVLRGCEGAIKPQLQKFLTTLILSPISSNSDLHQQCYTLIYQMYQSVPQVLLPVVPQLTSELQSGDGNKRLEAVQLLCKLLSLPGSKLVSEYEEVLEALLGRYQDTKVEVRLTMLESTTALVAGLAAGDLQQRVLKAAAARLQDFEEKVRIAAIKAVCQTSRQLLVGPPPTATAGASGLAANHADQLVLTSPPFDLLGQLASQDDDEAMAAELGLEYTHPETATVAAQLGVGLEAQIRDLAFVQDILQRVSLRLRDTKATVRKAAANGMMSVFRAVASAGDAEQVAKVCWLPCRTFLCMKSDAELRAHMFEFVMKDGLLAPQVPANQTAAVWVRVWLSASQLEKDALMLMLNQRTRAQGEALALVSLRRKTSGKCGDDTAATKQSLDTTARRLAQNLPQPARAMEGLVALLSVRDNHVFTALQQALAPDTPAQAFVKVRSEALARVGSRSLAAEFVTQLLLWARPAAWLPAPVLCAILKFVAVDPDDGQEGELVRAAFDLLQKLAKNTAMIFSCLVRQLLDLLRSPWSDLQQLGALLIARCCIQQRKLGLPPLSSSADATKLVKEQLLPCLRQLSRGESSAGAPRAARRQQQQNDTTHKGTVVWLRDEDVKADEQSAGMDTDVAPTMLTPPGVAAPKASKWAVYALATCQDSSSCKKELNQLADELAGSLDASEAETAGKLQAMSAVGRILPEVFGRHVDAVMSFVLDDYLLSYLDASITQPTCVSTSQHSRSPITKEANDASLDSQLTNSQAPAAAAVWLKAQAVKVLAAGCVPDSDSHDVPLETMRAVARLAQALEGLLEPGENARPEFLADVSAEVAGVFRLAAASSLLRLVRRHDSRITPSCYCMLALVMQDDLEGVRAAFSAKVFKVMRHFQMRPSTHQLGAKYAAMLPLSAVDPARPNKDTAARQLREWVHSRRAAVQQQVTAAAASAADGAAWGGGSTLQDLPEMIVPYSLYILAHHPDFPQGKDADDVSCYDPFQYMLQFMLQPLLVASGGTSAGATIPALVKMCKCLKRTADTADDPCTEQLYVLCDMSVATVKRLASQMSLDRGAVAGQYPGNITLPKGFYKPLDKDERGAGDVTYLPPNFSISLDPDPATALAQPPGQAPGAVTGGAGKSTAAGVGRGSKDRAQRKTAAAAAGDAGANDQRPERQQQATKGKRRHEDSDDGWDSDEGGSGNVAPSAQKAAKGQLTKRQQLLQQQRQKQHCKQIAGRLVVCGVEHSEGRSGEQHSPIRQQQHSQHQGKQQQPRQNKHANELTGEEGLTERQPNGTGTSTKQQHYRPETTGQTQQWPGQQKEKKKCKLIQQPLAAAFNQAAVQHAVADASSPAPATRSRPRAEQLLAIKRPVTGTGSESHDSAVLPSPAAPDPMQNGAWCDRSYRAHSSEADGDLNDATAPAIGRRSAAAHSTVEAVACGKLQAAKAKRPKSAPRDSQVPEDVSMQGQMGAVAGAKRDKPRGGAVDKVSKQAAAAAAAAAEAGRGPRAGAKRTVHDSPGAGAKRAVHDSPGAGCCGGARATRRRAA